MKKISVITITFNSEKTLERTIKSVINQTYKNLEYIIIDGGSTDKTIDIINKYKDKINIVVSEPDNGIYDAFNKGIRKSSGEIISILNSDDWYESNTLKEVEGLSKKINHSEYIICTKFRRWFNNKQYSEIPLKIKTRNKRNIFVDLGVGHPATFVSKSVYTKIGMYDVNYKISADSEFLLRSYFSGILFIELNETLVNMQDGGISNSPKFLRAKLKERKSIRNQYMSIYKNNCFFMYEFIKLNILSIFQPIMGNQYMKFILKTRNKIRNLRG
jgi:glycosyltransferase involved in cell wall biosynthesis